MGKRQREFVSNWLMSSIFFKGVGAGGNVYCSVLYDPRSENNMRERERCAGIQLSG